MKGFLLALVSALVLAPPTGAQEKAPSLREERREVIRFGIETELGELLAALKSEKDVSLVKEILALLETAPAGRIRKEIFDYFMEVRSPEARSAAAGLLARWEDEPPELLVSVLGYLAAVGSSAPPEEIHPLLEARSAQVVSAAVRYLGAVKATRSGARLRELFDSPDAGLQIRQEIILALGEMQDPDSVPFLMDLLGDEGRDMMLRRFACDALGRSGDTRALGAIKTALESKDNLLRSYAVSALGRFPGRETVNTLISALRDAFPRVRELAAERLGDLQARDAVEILLYRARRDPEKRVRQASFRSLSKIGGGEAVDFLQDYLAGEKNPVDFRSLAAEELIKNRPAAAVEPLLKTMEQEWLKDRSALLDGVCRLASQAEYSGFDALYEKMLGHISFVIQINGIRGIQRNRIGRLRGAVQEFTRETYHPQIRRIAAAALEDL